MVRNIAFRIASIASRVWSTAVETVDDASPHGSV